MKTTSTPAGGATTSARFAAERRIRRAIADRDGPGIGRALRHLGAERVAAVLVGAEPFGRACRAQALEAGRGPDLEAWAVVSRCAPEEVRRRLARSGFPVPERPQRPRRHWRQGREELTEPASFGPEPGPAGWQTELARRAGELDGGSAASEGAGR